MNGVSDAGHRGRCCRVKAKSLGVGRAAGHFSKCERSGAPLLFFSSSQNLVTLNSGDDGLLRAVDVAHPPCRKRPVSPRVFSDVAHPPQDSAFQAIEITDNIHYF